MRKLIALLAVGIFCASPAFAATLEDLLVEKGVITKSEAQASSHSGDAKVYWKKGTRLDFADQGFTAKINTQIQPRYEFTDNELSDNTSSFSLRRARLQISGNALHKEFDYKIQVGFVGDTGEDGAREPDLRDAYIRWHACDWGSVQMGQFKGRISRQEVNSSTKLQFPDRSIASDTFAISRNQGARAEWNSDDDNLMLSAAIFNGESEGEGRNRPGVDTKHTGVAAIRADLMGDMNAHEEGDIGMTEDTAVNWGAAYSYSDVNSDLGAGLDNGEIQRLSSDINLKMDGMSLHGEFFWANTDSDAFTAGEDTDPIGFYIQGGIMAGDVTEIAARYSQVDCDNGSTLGDCDVGTDQFEEVSVSLNYYWWGHSLKAQLAWSYLNEEAVDSSDFDTNRIIFQLSSYM